jgi:chaperonin GroEL
MAVKAPTRPGALADNLADVAYLVGGRPLLSNMGDRLEGARAENLGSARRVWADHEYVGLEAGKGDPRELRRHIAEVRRGLAAAEEPDDRQRIQTRLGRLIYGSAVLWVGASTPLGLEARKALAERTVTATRAALREGVVPGGGTALLKLKPLLQRRASSAGTLEERLAGQMLLRAVEAPIRTLLTNAGCEPETILAGLAHRPPGDGFDVMSGEYVNMTTAGILDSAAVVKSAFQRAVHAAALALTIDVLVQRANPPLGIKQT